MPRKTDSELHCACARMRQAARLLTQLYDSELKAQDIEAAQFALLATLRALPGASQAALCRALDMDKTTLSRNLGWLERRGWIEAAPAPDARRRGFTLTPQGLARLNQATPAWKRAHDRLRSNMTPAQWDAMWVMLDGLTQAARSAQSDTI